MLVNDKCIITDKEEKKIAKLLNLNPPECFEKMTEKEVESIKKVVNVNEHVIKRIRDVVVKNKIYENLKKINKKDLFYAFETKNLIEISNDFLIPPSYLLYAYIILKFNNSNTKHFSQTEIDLLYKNIKDEHNKINMNSIRHNISAYNKLIVAILKNMGISCVPFEKHPHNNIFIIENHFVIDDYRINWIMCINDYGCGIKKLYEYGDYKEITDNLKKKYGDGAIVYNYGYNEILDKEFDCKLYCYNSDRFNYENQMLTKKGEFYTISGKHLTTGIRHYYGAIFPTFITQFKILENSAILIIGVYESHELYLYIDYYPKAFIYGTDKNVEIEKNNFKIFKASEDNIKQMEKVRDKIIDDNKKLFLIIDNGHHIPEHQLASFNLYFDTTLMYGGYYIIESIETSYWLEFIWYDYDLKMNYGYRHKNSIIEIFKNIVDVINVKYMSKEDEKKLNRECKIKPEIRKLIMSITFSQNCIIIKKKSLEELAYENLLFDDLL